MWDRVEQAIQMIRPALQADGSDIELVGVAGGIVRLRLLEARGGCTMTAITMRTVVEKILKERVPEVIQVVAA
jgi:Fe-S cluster biogenesis protein NfuA